ncbi:unnamed protein product, partial [Protopolystoma xenopodis]
MSRLYTTRRDGFFKTQIGDPSSFNGPAGRALEVAPVLNRKEDIQIGGNLAELPAHSLAKTVAPSSSTQIGFINLPNQLHRKAVRRGFEFNIMIVGASGLGKSTFMNALFLSDIYNAENLGPSKRYRASKAPSNPNSSRPVDAFTFQLRENSVRLRLTVLDAPGFGEALDNSTCWQPLVDAIDDRFEAYMSAESRVSRTTVGSGSYGLSPQLP